MNSKGRNYNMEEYVKEICIKEDKKKQCPCVNCAKEFVKSFLSCCSHKWEDER